MNLRTVERAAWTLGIGAFLAVVLGALLSPDPTAFRPYAVGSLAVGLPVAHWYVRRRAAAFPSERAGRLTLFFLVLLGISYVGFFAVELAVAPDTTADLAGRAIAVVVALSVAERAASAGYDRLRAALPE